MLKANSQRLTKEERRLKKEAELLAGAIVNLLEWQHRQLQLKEERKVRAMITRQRNLKQRQSQIE